MVREIREEDKQRGCKQKNITIVLQQNRNNGTKSRKECDIYEGRSLVLD